MASHLVTGADYLRNPQVIHNLNPFKYTFLSEGDSWADKSTVYTGSLAQYLVWEMNKRGESVLIINISTAGDTMQRIEEVMNDEFVLWLDRIRFDAILFSAGGNDFIDAARDPKPGQGILRNMQGQPIPVDGYECAHQPNIALLKNYLTKNFEGIHKTVQTKGKNPGAPIFLNCYDTPTARNAPALKNIIGPWLYTAYQKNNIDPSLWPSLTKGLFADINSTLESFCVDERNVYAVPTTGRLTPAKEGSKGSSGDWANEIHPNSSGWKKLAKVWADTLLHKLA